MTMAVVRERERLISGCTPAFHRATLVANGGVFPVRRAGMRNVNSVSVALPVSYSDDVSPMGIEPTTYRLRPVSAGRLATKQTNLAATRSTDVARKSPSAPHDARAHDEGASRESNPRCSRQDSNLHCLSTPGLGRVAKPFAYASEKIAATRSGWRDSNPRLLGRIQPSPLPR